jgi:hypothetical protein
MSPEAQQRHADEQTPEAPWAAKAVVLAEEVDQPDCGEYGAADRQQESEPAQSFSTALLPGVEFASLHGRGV